MKKILRDSHIGENIKRIRLLQGYTQDQVVVGLHLLGSPLHRVSYAQIESGRNNIFVSDLVAMQQFFQVEYSEFFKDIPTSRQ